jgi:outer membrane lipoprotein-sorting protein
MHRHPIRFVLLLALLMAAGVATAQIDERAREFLEGLQTGEQADIRTLDQTMIATIYAHGVEQTVRTRTQIDYEGRRAAIETEPAPGMTIRIVVADGQTRVFMGGMAMPMPPGMDDTYGSIFEREPDLFAEGVSATYDGFQTYGDLLAGHQVMVRNAAVLPGVEGAQEQRLVFDDDGLLVGFVTEVAEAGVMVGVFDEPLRGNPFVGRDATMHLLLDDGTTRPFMRMRFEEARINEPIDPAAFD